MEDEKKTSGEKPHEIVPFGPPPETPALSVWRSQLQADVTRLRELNPEVDDNIRRRRITI